MICYGLHLRYTSLQVNRFSLEKFAMLSLPLLDQIQQSGVDALKALRIVHEKGSFSCDCILMIDEMRSINQESIKKYTRQEICKK